MNDISMKKILILIMGVFVMISLVINGLTIESFELTQMSWFPFLFAGALFSIPDEVNVSLIQEKDIYGNKE